MILVVVKVQVGREGESIPRHFVESTNETLQEPVGSWRVPEPSLLVVDDFLSKVVDQVLFDLFTDAHVVVLAFKLLDITLFR